VKAAEIAIMLLAAAAFALQSAGLLLFILFLTGTHSAFFGPAKYSILPQHLPVRRLVTGNGLLSLGTFVAILLGTIIGTLGIAGKSGVGFVAAATFVFAVAGFISSLYIPPAPPAPANAALPFRPLHDIREMMLLTLSEREARRCAIAISWFWFLGATYLAQFPNLVQQVFHADETVVTLFLVMFTLGVATGSLLCGKVLHDKISTRLAPYAAFALVIFGLDFHAAALAYPQPQILPVNISVFMTQGFFTLRPLFDLFMVAVSGGLFYVPLYAAVQNRTALDRRARVMAGIGLLNALFMVLSSLMGMLILSLGFTGLDVVFISLLLTLGMAWYCKTQ
jgi:hypothetical protein